MSSLFCFFFFFKSLVKHQIYGFLFFCQFDFILPHRFQLTPVWFCRMKSTVPPGMKSTGTVWVYCRKVIMPVQALCVLHVICTRLHPGHLTVCVGDSLWRSEEIVTNLELRLSVQLLLLLLTGCKPPPTMWVLI